MPAYQYHLVDVFTDRSFGGNQLAVFTDGASVPSELMPRFAKELNLAESTFVLPPTNPANNYRVRIFTPDRELPMAGHPTVGTAYTLARLGMIPRQGNPTSIVFEEGVGDIPVAISYEGDATIPSMIWMTQPKPRFGPVVEDHTLVREALSLPDEAIDSRYPVQVVSTGLPFLYVPIKTLADIKGITLNAQACRQLIAPYGTDGIFVFTLEVETPGSTVHSRMFAPGLGIAEDPATGAASGPLGAYLVHYGIARADAHIVSEQGLEMGRPSYIHIEVLSEGGELTAARIAGQCYYMGRGEFDLEL
jgi:trans-2,3-dihydro-3-hydroxyanthranilate isomerase